MPNLALTLRDEIRRLARKEIKLHLRTTRRATVQYRRDIARMKRELLSQSRRIATMLSRQTRQHRKDVASSDVEIIGTRFSSRSVRAQRRRLKLTAQQYGQLIGVSAQTVYLWERGATRPGKAPFAKLVAARQLGRREALDQLSPRTAGRGRRGRPK